MNLKSRFAAAAAAALLAFGVPGPDAFAVSENYVPSNAKFIVYFNSAKAVESPALKRLLSKDGFNLAACLDDVAMIMDDMNGDVTFFMTELDPTDFERSLMESVVYAPGRVNAIYNRLAGRDDIKTEALTEGSTKVLKIHVVNGQTDMLALFEFVSDDIMQCRLAINMPETKPLVWQPNPDTPMLVTSMKTKGSLVTAAVDAAYVQGRLAAEEEAHPRTAEEKKTKIKAGNSSIEIDEEDPDIQDIRENVRSIFARISEGARSSLDATITLRCTSSEVRDEVFHTVDGFVTLYTMLSGSSFEIGKDGKLLQKGGKSNPISTLKHEPKGNDAVFTLNLSEVYLEGVAKDAAKNAKKSKDKKDKKK